MKRIREFILPVVLFISAVIMISSCREDLSSLDINKIPGVTIDTTGMSSLDVFQFEQLEVKPNLTTGSLPESDLKYEWRLYGQGRLESEIVGQERNLSYEVRLKPNTANQYYSLVYTITDTRNGLQYIMGWHLTVKNNIGEGLVIAENTDGQQTDLSHIMSPEVTSDYTGESVKHNVYSSINGSYLPGIVKQMRFTGIYGVDALFAITNNDIFTVKTLDYTYGAKNDELFYGHSGDFKPQALGALYQGDIFIGNGKLYGTYLGASRKFGLPFDSQYVLPDHVGFNLDVNGVPVAISFYDEAHGFFVYQPSIASYGDRNMYKTSMASGSPFDPGNLANKINLAAGNGTDHEFLHLLKDKTSGNITLYTFTPGGYDDDYNLIPPLPKAMYNFSDAPSIRDAKLFVFLKDQRVMYYAAGSKIYAVLFSTSTPVFQEKYSAPSGEEITTLQLYQQALDLYNYSENPAIATNNKQLIMSTYGTEGKVYILPLINTGAGNIDQSKIKSFGGFGHITAIAPQK